MTRNKVGDIYLSDIPMKRPSRERDFDRAEQAKARRFKKRHVNNGKRDFQHVEKARPE